MKSLAKKISILLLCITIMAVSALSVTVLAKHAAHQCADATCVICLHGESARHNLEQLALSGASSIFALPFIIGAVTMGYWKICAHILSSLVSLRVRLDY